MYNALIEQKIETNQKIKEKHINKKLKKEYQTNINILPGQLKESFFAMFYEEDSTKRKKQKKEHINNTKKHIKKKRI